jgi:hypothetical protein
VVSGRQPAATILAQNVLTLVKAIRTTDTTAVPNVVATVVFALVLGKLIHEALAKSLLCGLLVGGFLFDAGLSFPRFLLTIRPDIQNDHQCNCESDHNGNQRATSDLERLTAHGLPLWSGTLVPDSLARGV